MKIQTLTKINSPSQSQTVYGFDHVTNVKIHTISLHELMEQKFSDDIWVVDHLILRNGINCIAGKPKSGKSAIVLQMAKNIAEGLPLFGKYKTSQTGLLLISKEDSLRLLQKRLLAYGAEPELRITFSIDSSIYLDTDKYLQSLFEICAKKDIRIIIFDSFRRFMRGDENSSEDVTKMHWFFKQLNDNGITVVFVHHFRKGNNVSVDSLRGSSDILAMVDSAIVLEMDKKLQTVQVTQNALREDKEEEPFSVKIPTFEDEDREFKYLGQFDTPSINAFDQALDDVLDFLNQQTEPVIQKTIIDELVTQDGLYQETYVKKALAKLCSVGKITPNKVGNKVFYCLSEQRSQEQTVLTDDGVTE